MKYNININQKGLENDKDITISDASVIDWLHTFCGSNSHKINKQKVDGWTWVSCQHLVDDMPLLRIKSRSGGARLLERLRKLGYIEIRKEPRKLFVMPTEKMDRLYIDTGAYEQQSGASDKNIGASEQQLGCLEATNHNTNNIILDTNTISIVNNTTEKEKETDNSIDSIETSQSVTLPEQRGKLPNKRVLTIYNDLFFYVFGFKYTANFGRDLKTINDLLQQYSEVQIARLLTVYFNWHGMGGNNDKDYNYLCSVVFPLTMFKANISKYEAYIRNVLCENFDDDVQMLKETAKHILSIRR